MGLFDGLLKRLENKRKYKKVVLLVHPFFDLIYKKNIDINTILQGNNLAFFKKSINTYSTAIEKYINRPDTLIILIEPHRDYKINSESQKLYQSYKEISITFYNYLKKILKDRFIVTDFAPIKDYKGRYTKLIDNKIYSLLHNDIEIIGFGEYLDKTTNFGCVTQLMDLAKKEFERKGIVVVKERIIYKNTFDPKYGFKRKTERIRVQKPILRKIRPFMKNK